MPTPPPYLLIAPTGMLGRAWRELLEARNLPWIATSRSGKPTAEAAGRSVGLVSLDLTDPASIDAALPTEADAEASALGGTRLVLPRAVINCAAWTDVDGAETHEDQAQDLNATGPAHLAQRCAALGIPLVHYSTDYVFNGHATSPYPTDAPIDPVNAYGRTKAAGEQAIRDALPDDHLIIRTSWLYAPWGTNFVLTMKRLTAEKDQLRVVADQRGRPTSCQHLAAASLALLDDHHARGTYHVTDAGETTWHGFTAEINRQCGHTCDVQPCTTADFPRPAPRPAYSTLDLSTTESLLGPLPDWRDNLRLVLDGMTG